MRSIFLQFLADLKHFPRPKNAYKDGNFVFRKKNARQEKNAFEFARKRRCLTSAFFTKTLFFCEHISTAEKSVKKIRKISFRMKNCAAKKNFRRSLKIDFRTNPVEQLPGRSRFFYGNGYFLWMQILMPNLLQIVRNTLTQNIYSDIFTNTLRDVAQLVARLVWDQDVAGSNPVIPNK